MASGLVKKTTTTVRKVRGRRMNAARKLAMYRQVKRQTNLYNFKRVWYAENYFSTAPGAPIGAGYAFDLNQLPNATDFQNLFDQYRINKIVVKIIPKISEATLIPNPGLTNYNNNLQVIHTAIDYDDSSAPTGIAELAQYDTYKFTSGNRVHTRVIVPKVELMNNGVSVLPKGYQWIDTDNMTVQHRGLKIWISPPNTPNTVVYYDLMVKMYASFKSVV